MDKYYFHFYNYVAQEEQTVFIKALNEEEAVNVAYLYIVSKVGKKQAEHFLKEGIIVYELEDEHFYTFEDLKKYVEEGE